MPEPSERDLNAVIGRPEGFFAVGDGGVFVTSHGDGEWVAHDTPVAANLLDVATDHELTIVAVGTGGVIVTSLDLGATWTLSASNTDSSLYGVAWTGAEFVTVGNQGTVLVSPDGLDWSRVDLGTDAKIGAIASNGVLTVAMAEDGQALVTTGDGQWTH